MIWFVILVTINTSGTVTATTHYPQSPTYNNESSCNKYGETLSNKIQMERGTNNSKVFWKCEALSYETVAKSMPKI